MNEILLLDSANCRILRKIAESANTSSLRGARSEASATKQSKKNNLCEAPKTRPLRGAKNREQTSSSASADFLLEAEKRGTPPKSEKAAAFWRVGGAGRGVQPFLLEETSESNLKNGVDSAIFASKIAESNVKSQNLNLDCHDSATQNLAMTENDEDSVNRRISHENAESKIKNTHPLTPSAREGGQKVESAPTSSLRGSLSESKTTKQSTLISSLRGDSSPKQSKQNTRRQKCKKC
ncbi:hypothetical protein ACWIUD_01760 [Helicobacter sp. 23-1044]